MTPLLVFNQEIVQGDGWEYVFMCYGGTVPSPPIPLSGSCSFSLRRNYGDPAPLIAMTDSTPSVNGSTIAFVNTPGISPAVLASVHPIVTEADCMLLTSIQGQKTTKFHYQISYTPTGGKRVTLVAGSWYVWSRV